MAAPSDPEFLRMLQKDIDYYAQALERFENMIPTVSAPLQDQWRLQAQARRNFALELDILLEKALLVAGVRAPQNSNRLTSDLASR
ncbi:MAG: hypothetical protein ABSF59_00610 [Candidatus Sulfotelmatobacter sp.]|jgi:hypothetical protein